MKTLIKISGIVILCILNFFLAKEIIQYLLVLNTSYEVISISASETLNIIINLDIIITIIMIIPILIYIFYNNYKDALKENERYLFKSYKLISLLFILGALFGYYISIYIFIPYLMNFNILLNITNTISLDKLYSFVIANVLLFGICFQLPLIIKNLIDFNIIYKKQFIKYRKHTFIILLIISAIITPPDILSLVITIIPLYLLFEVGLLISKKNGRKSRSYK